MRATISARPNTTDPHGRAHSRVTPRPLSARWPAVRPPSCSRTARSTSSGAARTTTSSGTRARRAEAGAPRRASAATCPRTQPRSRAAPTPSTSSGAAVREGCSTVPSRRAPASGSRRKCSTAPCSRASAPPPSQNRMATSRCSGRLGRCLSMSGVKGGPGTTARSRQSKTATTRIRSFSRSESGPGAAMRSSGTPRTGAKSGVPPTRLNPKRGPRPWYSPALGDRERSAPSHRPRQAPRAIR